MHGQVAIVTGGNQGLGKSIAMALHGAGANIALAARSPESLQAVCRNLSETRSDSALAMATDVSDEAQVTQLVARTLEQWGRIDILVNNAGLVSPGQLDQIGPSDWQRILDVNLTGAYLCCRAVAPTMQSQQYGRIINIASITAQTGGVSGGIHYSASKGGMISMTKTLARDLAPYRVTVNAVAPGQIDTRPDLLTDEERTQLEKIIPLGRLGRPEEIAYPVLFLASAMASYITGATLDINGGILKR